MTIWTKKILLLVIFHCGYDNNIKMNLWPTQNVFKKELSTYYVCRFPLASINFHNIGIDFNLDILRCSKRHVCVGAKVIKNSNLGLLRAALWGTHLRARLSYSNSIAQATHHYNYSRSSLKLVFFNQISNKLRGKYRNITKFEYKSYNECNFILCCK